MTDETQPLLLKDYQKGVFSDNLPSIVSPVIMQSGFLLRLLILKSLLDVRAVCGAVVLVVEQRRKEIEIAGAIDARVLQQTAERCVEEDSLLS